ncbi:hypothetical protein KIW84_031370 [Lathyrus oleraceus]|uniref:Uncharacterized protein n=1 Tax=Pisum sativum TaxID=3888 RepID=A0A9D5AV64_PEA|nr:hypothetical protein KIW84_031370 [Pisum sativum]
MGSDEVEVIDDGAHVENDGSQHKGSNVEGASEDNVTKEDNNAQRQEYAELVVRQRRRLNKDENGKPVNAISYKQVVGSLVAKYMEIPIEIHLAATKRILRR